MLILEREEEQEKNTDWLPSIHTLTRDRTQGLGMLTDQGLSLQPFGA